MSERLACLMILFILLVGCRQGGGDAHRLVELDSLIAAAPDSAAALLAAVPADSLPTAGDRAYHALLLTQARYKAYIPLDSTSLDTINLAVAHYADGDDGDKLTRSLLYKGCVMEELGRPDSAMYYYKAAEDHATQSGDTYHRGYALMRMASLFQSRYAKRNAIETFSQSLKCMLTVHSDYDALYAMQELGNLYIIVDTDSAMHFIDESIKLSLQLDSCDYGYSMVTKAACCFKKAHYKDCIKYGKQAIELSHDRPAIFRACNWIAQAYAKLGEKDSGAYYLDLSPLPGSKEDTVLYLSTMAAMGVRDSVLYHLKAGNVADTLLNIEAIASLTNASKHYDQLREKTLAEKKNRNMQSLLIASTIILLLAAALVYWTRKRKEHTLADAIEDGNKIISTLESELKASDDLAYAQQTEIGQLSDELDKQRQQNQALESAVCDREAKITDHETIIQDLSEAVTERDKAIRSLVADQSRLMDKRDSLLRQSARLSQDLLSIKIKLVSTEQERNEIRKNAEQMRDQVNSQRHQVMAIVSEMSQGAAIFYQTLMLQDSAGEAVSAKFRQYVNANFMSRLKGLLDVAYPVLAQRMTDAKCDSDDEDTVYLHFAGFSNEMICCYLNLTNKKTISNKKRSIATSILGQNASISQLAE